MPVLPSSIKLKVLLFVSVISITASFPGGVDSSKNGADKDNFIDCSFPVVFLNQSIDASITNLGSASLSSISITSSQEKRIEKMTNI